MWKSDKSSPPSPSQASQPSLAPVPNPGPTAAPVSPNRETRAHEPAPKPVDSFRAEVGHIGKSVFVKGELSGSEDLYLDGEVEGSIDLRNHSLVIGPNGRIRATIHARELVVHGKIDGNVNVSERVELRKSSSLVGDISTQRIVIEDGAFFKGSIDLQKEAKPEQRKTVSAAPGATNGVSLVAAGHSSFAE
ncbi:MAG TPA: polymer-forming cytoskeletal protein [Candidatus Angelobacter sp.]|nr:polymer-forming cytoskeletal protein [Candidatus Angelobacter sp.]